jgi:mannobiose 2-epimerase
MTIKNSIVRRIKTWHWRFHTVEKSSSVERYSPGPEILNSAKEVLARILTDNIIAFWYPRSVDLRDGGYLPPRSIRGKGDTRADKSLIAQARTLWFFSRLVNSDYQTDGYLETAKHGYQFLRDRLWDKDFGGFFWQVDSTGNTPSKPDKHLYGQAFGLYALAEYADASGDSGARRLAEELFDLLELYAHDSEFGGYRESFLRNWRTALPDGKNYMGASGDSKLMNTHLHLMEALTRYYRTIKQPIAKERLIELVFVNSNSVVRKDLGACSDRYRRNWEPLRGPKYERVSYGHDLENVWLLVDACRTAGLANHLLLDLYRSLFRNALRYGSDQKSGGFYASGPFNSHADQRDKLYWVQAESLVSALQMYRLTGEKIYWNCFSQTLKWINRHQVDWQGGDWHVRTSSKGTPRVVQDYAWSSPYHQGRAVLTCLEWLGARSDYGSAGRLGTRLVDELSRSHEPRLIDRVSVSGRGSLVDRGEAGTGNFGGQFRSTSERNP